MDFQKLKTYPVHEIYNIIKLYYSILKLFKLLTCFMNYIQSYFDPLLLIPYKIISKYNTHTQHSIIGNETIRNL